MKGALARLVRRLDQTATEGEIEEQLCFHLDLLTAELLQREMTAEQAQEAAIKRFGNVEQIKAQCLTISNRNRPLLRALKSVLILVFLLGVLVRFVGSDYHVTHIGDTLIMVGLLGRLLLYVRGLNPSSLVSKTGISSPLMLDSVTQTSSTAGGHRGLTKT
jgi:hypothetical protein